MYLRCSRCHESTWIRTLVPGMVENQVECQDCGHGHDLSQSCELGETGKQQYDTANSFATTHGVDLPTAYSVLLGLMSLTEALEVDAERKEEKRKQAVQPAIDDVAIDAPPLPAPRRRPLWGSKNQRNEQTVTVHVEREMARERRRITAGQLALLLMLATLTIGLSGRHAYLTWRNLVDEGRAAEKNTAASAAALENARQKELAEARENQPEIPAALQPKFLHDAQGRLTQVSGPNPMTVLHAYCEATAGRSQREPLELAQASPPGPNVRYGIFRDFARLETNHAIRIRQDRATNRWVAGDGRGPIRTRDAPDQPKTIQRVARNDER